MRFSDEEVRRYARQMVLREVGGIGQERLRASSARAESELEALYLAAAGIGRLSVPSVEIAEAARALNPLVSVEVEPRLVDRIDPAHATARALATLKEALAL